MRFRKIVCLWVAALFISGVAAIDGLGADQMRAPTSESPARQIAKPSRPRGGAIRQIVRLFRTTITKVDGNRCAMYPTCSHYGEQALSKHGAVVGTWMFIDRLFHEWSEMSVAPKVQVHGVERYWDPLEENNFWLKKDKKEMDRSPHSPDGSGQDSAEPRVSPK